MNQSTNAAASELTASLPVFPQTAAEKREWLQEFDRRESQKQLLANRIPGDLNLEEHLVAFIDILGFRNQIAAAKSKQAQEQLYLKIRTVQREFAKETAAFDPGEQTQINRNYGKRVLALSDAVVVAVKLNSLGSTAFGEYDVVGQAIWDLMVAQARCACRGIFVRGGIAHGSFFYGNDVLMSPALATAYELESKAADFPVIVADEDTRNWILNRGKKRFYATDSDPVPPYFMPHSDGTGSKTLWALDYMRLLVNEQHRGMSAADRSALRRARKKNLNVEVSKIHRRSQLKDAAWFLGVHRRAIVKAYRANCAESVRRKYRWLMAYHNRSFKSWLPYLRTKLVDLRSFPAPKALAKTGSPRHRD